MRLGIRRKLIGTLMLVGLLPLALSLAVILGGGAAMRLHSIRSNYENSAMRGANEIANTLDSELKELVLIARQPQVINYARDQSLARAARLRRGAVPAVTQPDEYVQGVEKRWPGLTKEADPVRGILHNPLSDRLRALCELDNSSRQILATDAYGELIAGTDKPADYFQADEEWWQRAFFEGKGRPYISTVVVNPANGAQVVEVVVPIYDDGGERKIIGIIKDKLEITWIREQLKEIGRAADAPAGQLYDVGMRRTVYSLENEGHVSQAEQAYLRALADPNRGLINAFLGDLLIGAETVPFEKSIKGRFPDALVPQWVVIVSKPTQAAMVPVYKLAGTVAAIGVALILVLFVLGVAIANREIILPILRLREAAAAVGRGELNIRLMSGTDTGNPDPTFRDDELGQLAHDFDEMTRQLQKNVGQLAKSNEAKRRFMELAGHELRTPVTFIMGVCQLAQRQLQMEEKTEVAAGGGLGVRSPAQMGVTLGKISAKAQRLSRIIENLLKLVNNDSFTTRLVKQPIDMRALVLQVCNDARPFIVERKQQLVCDVAESMPMIEGDRDKLEDAITNLVTNAIRFSPDNSVVKVVAHPVVGDMLEILVEDSGPGIPPADMANLFEPFYTTANTMTHHSGTIEYGSRGIGLGLAIVRRFVEIHDGIVRVINTGHGTQFQILLPINVAPAKPEFPGDGAGKA